MVSVSRASKGVEGFLLDTCTTRTCCSVFTTARLFIFFLLIGSDNKVIGFTLLDRMKEQQVCATLRVLKLSVLVEVLATNRSFKGLFGFRFVENQGLFGLL